jgi:FKBP-type peptidyl-prolyl cis-trans isomerase
MSRRLLALTLTAALALAAAGCGSSNDSTSSSASAPADTGTTAAQQPATAQPRPKPKVTVPKGKPPKKLVVKDLDKGTGPAAKPGDPITVNYIGVNYADGKPFDNSYDRGQPFPFQLGGGQVIAGWDNGLVGMRVGGRRMLIIPPNQGYGAQGQPPVIKPNETLVFVVDLLSIG